MNRSLCLVGACFLLVGCVKEVVVVVEDPGHDPLPPEVEVIPAEDPATIAEIDAAKKLTFDSDRASVLGRIAQRRLLPATVQVHLVDTAMTHLTFSTSKERVLHKLIRNPYFANAGKQRILERLDHITFSSDKERVLHAIADRGPLAY